MDRNWEQEAEYMEQKCFLGWKVAIEEYEMLVFQMDPGLSLIPLEMVNCYFSFFSRSDFVHDNLERLHSTQSLLLTQLHFAVRVCVAEEPFQDWSLEALDWLIACLSFGFFPVFHHG